MGNFLPSYGVEPQHCTYSIEDACLVARSGDILLFTGTSLEGHIITTVTSGHFSHIGIIFRDCENPKNNRPLVLEAVMNADEVHDVYTHKRVGGVRVVDMYEYLTQSKQQCVCIRQLQSKKSLGIEMQFHGLLTGVMRDMVRQEHGKPYETSFIEFVNARLRLFEITTETPASYFCSELVAWCYMNIGLLIQEDGPARQYLPDDFAASKGLRLRYPKLLPFPGFSPATSSDEQSNGSNDLIQFSPELYIDITRKCVPAPPVNPYEGLDIVIQT